MVTSHTFIKNVLLTVAIAGIFCCLTLVAQAYHMVLTIESEIAETNQLAAVINDKFETEPIHTEAIDELVLTTETEVSVVDKPEEEKIPETEAEPVVTKTIIKEEPVLMEETIITPSPKPTPTPTNDFAAELINLIERETNSFRKANDLSPLSSEADLQQNARKYSQTMIDGNFMSHTNQDGCDLTCRFKADGYVAPAWGENLAMIKFDRALSAEKVADYFMTGWKKSSGHRDNLLSSDFTHQGVGVAYSNNAVYVSVQFAKQ